MLLLLPVLLLGTCQSVSIGFASDDATLSEGEIGKLAGAAAGDAFFVVAHADDQGSPEDNLALSQRRADAIVALLVARGLTVTEVRVVGESEPVVAGEDEDARAKNREALVTVCRDDGVLDLPLQKTEAPAPPRPKLQTRARPPPAKRPLDALPVELREPTTAVVVGVGAACGASVVCGACCFAPFTAPIGANLAAEAIGEAAGPNAASGAGAGAIIGGVAGVALTSGLFFAFPSNGRNESPLRLVFAAPIVALTITGAGVGAVVGWTLD